MTHKAPSKSDREGISNDTAFADMFPTEESAREWFESCVWPDGRYCPQCGSTRTHDAGHNHMPYRCSDCRSYFSVKTGTVMHMSRLPLRKWVFAIYLHLDQPQGRIQHEAAPGYRCLPENGVVHATAHPRGLEQR